MADQGAEGWLSPFLRWRRMAMARPHLRGRVLDVGCGAGGLAVQIRPEAYLGVDTDPVSLELARRTHPGHRFQAEMPVSGELFDTVVALAVIEHVSDPGAFLARLGAHLRPNPGSRILVTTPHPRLEWAHQAGAAVGLFSQHAREEHQALLDRSTLVAAAAAAQLEVVQFRTFLLGANQMALLTLGCGRAGTGEQLGATPC